MIATTAMAQFGLEYHTSALSMAGVNYTFNDRILTSFRLGTNITSDDAYGELIASYIVAQKDDFDVYIGLGATSGPQGYDGGGVIPLGINFYPFENKAFGFQSEVSYLNVDDGIIRGTLGIRYRFLKD